MELEKIFLKYFLYFLNSTVSIILFRLHIRKTHSVALSDNRIYHKDTQRVTREISQKTNDGNKD